MKEAKFVLFGGGGAIGTALTHRLIDAGASVFVLGRNQEKLEALQARCGAGIGSVDATNPNSVEAGMNLAVEHLGGAPDGVANLVGSIILKPAHLTSDAEWDETLRVNLSSSFFILRSAVKRMRTNGGGAIALVSTVAAARGLANHEAIAAAKAGVEGLARSAAATYAGQKIRANVVAPALTETPLSAPILSSDIARKASLAMHPLGRLGAPDDVASALHWLLDPANSWVTGQTIGVDGGLGRVQTRARV